MTADVLVVVETWTPLLESEYPETPEPVSVDAVQVTVTLEESFATSVRSCGVVGGVVSGGTGGAAVAFFVAVSNALKAEIVVSGLAMAGDTPSVTPAATDACAASCHAPADFVAEEGRIATTLEVVFAAASAWESAEVEPGLIAAVERDGAKRPASLLRFVGVETCTTMTRTRPLFANLTAVTTDGANNAQRSSPAIRTLQALASANAARFVCGTALGSMTISFWSTAACTSRACRSAVHSLRLVTTDVAPSLLAAARNEPRGCTHELPLSSTPIGRAALPAIGEPDATEAPLKTAKDRMNSRATRLRLKVSGASKSMLLGNRSRLIGGWAIVWRPPSPGQARAESDALYAAP